jgi:hypothetical protein
VPHQKTKAEFIEPMLLVRSDTLPEGPNWAYELKLDGYRPVGIKSYGVAHLRSRNNKSFDGKYPAIVQALARLPDKTVLDGEVVALNESKIPEKSTGKDAPRGGPQFFGFPNIPTKVVTENAKAGSRKS